MVFRVEKTENYTVMSNYHLRDKKLSLKAKGLLSWMLSNNNGWDYSIAGIVANCKENETAIRTALDELKQFGYLKVNRIAPNNTCNTFHYEYVIYENPEKSTSCLDSDFLYVENLDVETLDVENQVQRNTKERSTKISNTKKEKVSNDTTADFQFGRKTETTKPKQKKESLWDKCISLIQDFTDDEILRGFLTASLKMFLENARESNTPFFSNTFKGKLNALQKLSEDNYEQRKIVQQTLDKGWSNFYEIKQNTSRQKVKDFARDVEHMNSRTERANKEDMTIYEAY